MGSQQKNEGCIVDINGKEMIVLTNSGEFISLPLKNKSLQVGDIINLPRTRIGNYVNYLFFIATAAVLLLLLLPSFYKQDPVVWISLDVNPSMEIGLDKKQNVVQVIPMNNDARKILNNITIKSLPIDQALTMLLTEMQQEKYIDNEKDNTIIVTFAAEKGFEGLQNNTAGKVKNLLHVLKEKRKIPLKKIFYTNIDLKLRNTAHAQNLSFGKFVVYKKAKEKGINITTKDLSEMPVTKAIYRAGGELTQLFSPAESVELPISEKEKKFLPDSTKFKKEEKVTKRRKIINKIFELKRKGSKDDDKKEKVRDTAIDINGDSGNVFNKQSRQESFSRRNTKNKSGVRQRNGLDGISRHKR